MPTPQLRVGLAATHRIQQYRIFSGKLPQLDRLRACRRPGWHPSSLLADQMGGELLPARGENERKKAKRKFLNEELLMGLCSATASSEKMTVPVSKCNGSGRDSIGEEQQQ